MKKIALLDPYIQTPSTSCIHDLRNNFPDYEFSVYVPSKGQLPNHDNSYDAIVSFGSFASIHDNNEWIPNLKDFFSNQLEKKKPIFGICFTHQMIAEIYGGCVEYINSDKSPLKGIRELTPTDNSNIDSSLRIGFCQEQYVSKISDDFNILAGSNFSPYEILRHKTLPCLTVQGHPEASETFLQKEILISDTQDIIEAQKSGLQLFKYFFKEFL